MSGNGTFGPQQVEDVRMQLRGLSPDSSVNGGSEAFPFDRSFHRLGLMVGLGASAVGAYYGGRYLMEHFNNSKEQSNNGESGMSRTTSESSGIETVEIVGPKKDINVVLHQCPRGYNTPCISPFSMKLETFLRVSKIPYEVKYSAQPHLKNSPWLTVGEHDIVDAHECITFLRNTFGIDLECGAKPSRLTASRLVGIQLDNHIYWGIALWRWVFDKGESLKDIQPLSPQALNVITSVSESVRRAAWYHGLGRLPYEKVLEIITTDLADLSAALGRHDYFLGKNPGEIDCNAFSMLSQILWNMPSSPFEAELKKYENLVNFVLRMREIYWPDWEELLHKPGEHKVPEKFYYPTSEFHMSMTGIKAQEQVEPNNNSSSDANGNLQEETNAAADGPNDHHTDTTVPSLKNTAAGLQSRARSMPVKSKETTKVVEETSAGGNGSLPMDPPPNLPSRLRSPTKSHPPPNVVAPQLIRTGGTNYPCRPLTGQTCSQAQLHKIKGLLNDLNKQFETMSPEVSNGYYYSNNAGVPAQPFLGSPPVPPAAATQGNQCIPNAPFYPGAPMPLGNQAPGAFGPSQPTPYYYNSATGAYFPGNPYYNN